MPYWKERGVLMGNIYNKKIRQPLFTLVFILALWELIILTFDIPNYILPDPRSVILVLFERYEILLTHSLVTIIEICLGLVLGISLGLLFALLLLINRRIERWFLPIIIISQAIPFFAIAPILMLWLGYGMGSKVVMTAIIIFFPITTCCFDGLRSTPKGYLDLCKTLNLTLWQTILRVRFPAALPSIGSGIRVSVVIAPIGAVIGEWVGASEGLGYFMLQSNARMMIPDLFAALFILCLFSVFLYFITDFFIKKLIKWPI